LNRSHYLDSNLSSSAPNQPVQIDNISNNVNAKQRAFKQWLQNCGIGENDQGAVRDFSTYIGQKPEQLLKDAHKIKEKNITKV
jgi:phosphoglycerate-specific signal transduction histidine kinase